MDFRGKHLGELAHYAQVAKQFDPAMLETLLKLRSKERRPGHRQRPVRAGATIRCAGRTRQIIFRRRSAISPSDAMRCWINLLWFLPHDRSPLSRPHARADRYCLKEPHLPSEIGSHGERVLSLLAKKQPERSSAFRERLAYADVRKGDDRCEAVPYAFHGLQSASPELPCMRSRAVRRRFVKGDRMFQFGGGRLLAGAYPDFRPIQEELLSCVRTGDREDVEFVIRTLSAITASRFSARHAARSCAPLLRTTIFFWFPSRMYWRQPASCPASSEGWKLMAKKQKCPAG